MISIPFTLFLVLMKRQCTMWGMEEKKWILIVLSSINLRENCFFFLFISMNCSKGKCVVFGFLWDFPKNTRADQKKLNHSAYSKTCAMQKTLYTASTGSGCADGRLKSSLPRVIERVCSLYFFIPLFYTTLIPIICVQAFPLFWLLFSSPFLFTPAPNQMKSKERRSPGRSSRYDDYDRDSRRRRSRSRSYDRYRSRSPSYDRRRRRSESPREWVFCRWRFKTPDCYVLMHLNLNVISLLRSRGRMCARGRSRSREDDRCGFSLSQFR